LIPFRKQYRFFVFALFSLDVPAPLALATLRPRKDGNVAKRSLQCCESRDACVKREVVRNQREGRKDEKRKMGMREGRLPERVRKWQCLACERKRKRVKRSTRGYKVRLGASSSFALGEEGKREEKGECEDEREGRGGQQRRYEAGRTERQGGTEEENRERRKGASFSDSSTARRGPSNRDESVVPSQ
jgi:hypothetical protein